MASTTPTTTTTTLVKEKMQEEPELFFVSLNDHKPRTVVLLHGLLNSHLEWSFVTPYLKDYHILAPDLSGHSGSLDILPPDVASSTERVAHLIARYAKGGRAHVVGLSMGGFVALRLGTVYPDLVLSAVVTGAHPMERQWAWVVRHPYLVYLVMLLALELVPPALFLAVAARWYGAHLRLALLAEMRRNCRWEVLRAVNADLRVLGWHDVAAVRVRTLSIAGGAMDDVEAVRRMGRELPVEGSRGAVVRGAVHTWDLQRPELFAQTIRAWVEEADELPLEVVTLR